MKRPPKGADNPAMPRKPEESAFYSMRSVDRVASILNYLAAHGASPIAQIADGTDLPRPTTLRLVEALARHGLLARVERSGYGLGPRLVFLAAKSFGIFDLKSAARTPMHRLAAETGETAALSIRVESARMYVDQVESSQSVRRVIELNQPLPIHSGASGKALLAWLPEERVTALLQIRPLEPLTPQTVTDPDRLLAQLREVRRIGYAVTRGERIPDGAGLAAPILATDNEVLGAVTLLSPIHRTTPELLLAWAPRVVQAAREIAVACGALPPL